MWDSTNKKTCYLHIGRLCQPYKIFNSAQIMVASQAASLCMQTHSPLAGMHVVECFVDVVQSKIKRCKLIHLQFPIHVTFDQFRNTISALPPCEEYRQSETDQLQCCIDNACAYMYEINAYGNAHIFFHSSKSCSVWYKLNTSLYNATFTIQETCIAM